MARVVFGSLARQGERGIEMTLGARDLIGHTGDLSRVGDGYPTGIGCRMVLEVVGEG